MEEKDLQKLTKKELIEKILEYKEKLAVKHECREILRMDFTQGAIN